MNVYFSFFIIFIVHRKKCKKVTCFIEKKLCFKKHYIHFSIYHADVATPPLDGGLCNSCATANISYQGRKSQPPGLPSFIHCFITAADKASHPCGSSAVYTPPPYHCKSSLDPKYSNIMINRMIIINIKNKGTMFIVPLLPPYPWNVTVALSSSLVTLYPLFLRYHNICPIEVLSYL